MKGPKARNIAEPRTMGFKIFDVKIVN